MHKPKNRRFQCLIRDNLPWKWNWQSFSMKLIMLIPKYECQSHISFNYYNNTGEIEKYVVFQEHCFLYSQKPFTQTTLKRHTISMYILLIQMSQLRSFIKTYFQLGTNGELIEITRRIDILIDSQVIHLFWACVSQILTTIFYARNLQLLMRVESQIYPIGWIYNIQSNSLLNNLFSHIMK